MVKFFDDKHQVIAISPVSVIQTVAILLGLYFLFLIKNILTLVFLAFILTVALSPITKVFQRHLKMPRLASIVITYLLFVTTLILFFAILIPPLVHQLTALVKFINIPVLQEEVANFNFTLTDISNFASRIGSSVTALFGIITSTFSGIFTTFTLLIMSFFLLQERDRLHKKMRWFTKNQKTIEKTRIFIDEIELQLGGWVRGQLILMITIGTITYLGLLVLGVPYALPLALLAGLLEILPNIGPTIAAVPAIGIAFIATQNPLMALAVLILNVVIQQLENNVIVPKVMNDNANVSPLVSIISILIGLQLGGVIGALLAVPLYIVIRAVYVTFFYIPSDKPITTPKG